MQIVAQLVKNPPSTQETWVLSLGWEDPMEKGKATHSSILAWGIPWGRRVGHDWTTFTFTHTILYKGLEVPQILIFVWVGGVLEQVPCGFWGKIVLRVFHVLDTHEQNCHDWIQEAYSSHGWFYSFEGYKKLELGQVNIACISFGQLFNE